MKLLNRSSRPKWRRDALGAGLLAALTLVGQPIAAHDAQPAFEMVAIKDQAQGRSVVHGRYDQAIRRLESARPRYFRDYAATINLCVAYTMTARFEAASGACDSAIAIGHRGAESRSSFSRDAAARDLALALSNRGVLRAVSGDDDGAAEDFAAAIETADLKVSRDNLALLNTRSDAPTGRN